MQATPTTDPFSAPPVPSGKRYDKVELVEPTGHGYLNLAAEVDRRPPWLPASAAKRALVDDLKRRCAELEARKAVVEARVFVARLIPPGRGAYLESRPHVHVARFDVVVHVITKDVAAAQRLRDDEAFAALRERVDQVASRVHTVVAHNARRIGDVDHERDGVFLFNFFTADDTAENLAVWEYTAGWFQQETGLDNSTLMLPAHADDSDYNVINHCRWDHWRDIIPSLVFKRSFRDYVLASFEARHTAAIPILYRLA